MKKITAKLYLLCFVGVILVVGARSAPAEEASKNDTETSAELARVRKDLQDLRKQYSDLYLESRELQQKVESLNLYIAALLKGDAGGQDSKAEQQLLAALEHRRTEVADIREGLNEFGEYLIVVLDAMQPSKVMRRELMTRLEKLTAKVQQLAQPSPLVARRGGNRLSVKTCRVLAVNDQLQIVVLSAGTDDGLSPGMIWHIPEIPASEGQLRIIEVRSKISAAVVTGGSLNKIAPGMTVKSGRGE